MPMPFESLLFNAETKRTLALPKLCLSPPCPCSVLLLNAVAGPCDSAPLRRCSLPWLFIAFHCLYFTMPVLTSRCSASAIRFLSLPRRILTLPRLNNSFRLHAGAPRISSLQYLLTAVPGSRLIQNLPLKSAFAGITPLAQTVIASEVEPIHDTADKFAPRHDVELDIRSCRT